jgi:phage baseplate assembly protein gpV
VSAALLYDSIARIARHEAAARPIACVGVVTSLFPHEGVPDHAVSVRLRESGLVLPRVPVAVGAMGMAAIPAVDDLVVVAFLDGAFDAPVVIGRLYHPDQQPPAHKDGQIVLRLPSGASSPDLACEIDADPARLRLTLPGDVTVDIAGERVSIAVGDLAVRLDGAGGGRLTASAGGTSITLKPDGDLTLKSPAKIRIEGSEVEIAGQSRVKVTGTLVELN